MIFKDLRTNNFVIVRDDLMAKDYLRDSNYRIAKDAEWNEADHPRSSNGQFGSGGGSSKGSKTKLSSSEEFSMKRPSQMEKSMTTEENKLWNSYQEGKLLLNSKSKSKEEKEGIKAHLRKVEEKLKQFS